MTSLYKQALDLMASQAKHLADGVVNNMVMETAIPLVPLNWSLLENYRGVVLAWDDKPSEYSPGSTNCRDARGYPAYFLFIYAPDPPWDEYVPSLKQALRRYYNHRRRMTPIVDVDVTELPCRVLESFPKPPQSFKPDVDGLTVIAWFHEPRTT